MQGIMLMKSSQPTQPVRVRSMLLLKQVIGFICLAGAISVVLTMASRPAATAKQLDLSENSPQTLAMKHLLAASRGMSFNELCQARVEPRQLVTELSFDPADAHHFDQIKTKLKLTDEELQRYRQHGFVSVDHDQRYSFGSAYYQIYTAHLPVFVTSDSILHALHRSFDDLLAELESTSIVPLLDSILAQTHDSLVVEEQPQGLKENFLDVDLYLCVARNLLARKDWGRKKRDPASLDVPSKFDQDDEVRAILRSIDSGKIQIPGCDATRIYGGTRAVDYSQYTPRGHYTTGLTLPAYFRCMMWLSRADCGWFIQPVDPITKIVNDPIRELKNASLLTISLRDAGQYTQFESMNRLLSHFASQDDNLSAHRLDALLTEHGIRNVEDLNDEDRLLQVFEKIGQAGLGAQMIRSQAIYADDVSYTVEPPSIFQLFGQKFVIDSFVLSNVVFDSIIFENEKIKRFMPMGLDVMAALGNDEAVMLLEPELRKYNYSANLFAASQFVDTCTPEFWQRDLYNVWLDSIRELDEDIADEKNVPEVMKTSAWQRKQLQTQLASWAEFRHDMVLYAKQSYTCVPGCEYPDGYVEPYPAFYRKLRGFAEGLRAALLDFRGAEKVVDSNSGTPLEQAEAARARLLQDNRITYSARLIEVLTELEAIASAELRGDEMTEQQIRFLQQTIDHRGSLPLGSGSQPRFDGWYCDLFYNRGDVRQWDPTVIDVHTFPNPFGDPLVLEVGVGDVNLGVIAVNCDGTSTAYVGPLYSYYEFHQPANNRLTDSQWQQMIAGSDLPEGLALLGEHPKNAPAAQERPHRPEWTNLFQACSKKRTIDGLAVNVFDGKIILEYIRDDEKPRTKSFPATNAGVAAFVDFVSQQKFAERLSLNFAHEQITSNMLDELKRLDNLVFVAIPESLMDDVAVERFRTDRPEVELRPNELQFVRAEMCECVSGYQTFVPRRNKTVVPGDSFQIYVELRGLHVRPGMFRQSNATSVRIAVQVVDSSGRQFQEQLFSELKNTACEFPRWVYRAAEFQLADDIPVGSYRLNLQITDELNPANPTVSASLPLEVSFSESP
jgi:hypothetical protein